jgi:hypothetical protein
MRGIAVRGELPAEESGSPGEPGAEATHEYEVAASDASLLEGAIESEGDGGGGRITDGAEIIEDAAGVDTEFLHGVVDDADIGLVEDEEGDIIGGDTGFFEDGGDGFCDGVDGPFEDISAIHLEEVSALLNEFWGEWE